MSRRLRPIPDGDPIFAELRRMLPLEKAKYLRQLEEMRPEDRKQWLAQCLKNGVKL